MEYKSHILKDDDDNKLFLGDVPRDWDNHLSHPPKGYFCPLNSADELTIQWGELEKTTKIIAQSENIGQPHTHNCSCTSIITVASLALWLSRESQGNDAI